MIKKNCSNLTNNNCEIFSSQAVTVLVRCSVYEAVFSVISIPVLFSLTSLCMASDMYWCRTSFVKCIVYAL